MNNEILNLQTEKNKVKNSKRKGKDDEDGKSCDQLSTHKKKLN